MTRESPEQINEAASAWAIRAERGLTEIEEARFQDWIAGDPRRLGAFGRMTALLERTERAAALGTSLKHDALVARKHTNLNRRTWLAGGSVIAASAVGFSIFGVLNRLKVSPIDKVYRTNKGGKQVVALDDGSVARLNTTTTLSVAYTKAHRMVRLEGGEAFFEVAKDALRPFIVQAGDTLVRAVGTSFNVSCLPNSPVEVLVREGVVAVSRAARIQQPVRVVANSKATIVKDQAPVRLTTVDAAALNRDLAWQDGRIIIEGETLAAAAAKFERYSNIRIVVGNGALARERISGVFDADDPVTFARTVAVSLDAEVVIGADEARIVR